MEDAKLTETVNSLDGMGTGESSVITETSTPKLLLRVLIEEDGIETLAWQDPELKTIGELT